MLVNVVFQFATSEYRRYPKPPVVRIDLSSHLVIKNIHNQGRNGKIWTAGARPISQWNSRI